ncbi:TRAP transporter substrate-binding protein DctP [Terrarubrum flagellatum]|uniref:TRAP transporter substrate-binding protein DctP n=1 Tax=Terrirubrum flagellatum TaxID=2895980 RepID=UPI0031453D62
MTRSLSSLVGSFRQRLFATRLAAGAAALLCPAAIAQSASWDMATTAVPDSAQARVMQAFVANISARAEGQFAVTIYPPNSIMKPPEVKDAVRRGVVPIGEFTLSLHAGEAPIYGVDSVPFLATTYEAARRLYEAQKPFLEKRLADEGLKLLYSAPYMPQGLCAAQPLPEASGLRGLKLRSYNHMTKKLALLSGAVPTSIDTGEIAAAMKGGRLDVFTASAGQVAARKVWTFAPYFYDASLWIPRDAVVVNKAQFEALPAEIRKAMLDAAKFAEDRAWEAAAADYAEQRAALKAAGATVIQPTPGFMAAFAGVGRQIADEWVKLAGADGEAIMQAYRK